MRRGAPALLVTLGLVMLVGWYVAYSQHLVAQLRHEASRSAQMYARVYKALADPSDTSGTAALLDLSSHIDSMGVPVIVTDARGRPTAKVNLPFEGGIDDPRVAQYVRELDTQNPPVVEPGVGTVHFGNPPLVRSLRIIPIAQAMTLALLLFAGAYTIRTRGRAEREHVWAGMARESAHQLGTPLSSLSGWIELLRDRDADELTSTALQHMETDLERLERVAHRFERIGRPPRRERLDAGLLAEQVATYFRARVPTLAHTVRVTCERPSAPLDVEGDPVLLEWALEAITKNAIDALAGRGGRVDISAGPLADGGVRIRIADDGPGVPRELRSRIFEAGFSTKERGWGVGLSLARRIVEENHGGRLVLAHADRGATFDVILR
ncbi:MAG TPA: HAMP domain-containing sensor histidine kinase [Gemmatimonadaceae bacterium]|nr:HAMP domain-containing sensor histidine kinase [Gemmatimonadaceae bacterium]